MPNVPAETLETFESLARAVRAVGLPNPAPLALLDAARVVRKAAAVLKREAESACNGVNRYDLAARRVLATWTESDESRHESRVAKADAEVTAALRGIFGSRLARVEIEFQRDPRGAMVKLWRKGERNHGSPLACF